MKEKPCKICGEMFVPKRPSNTICPKDHFVSCPVCGQQMVWNSTSAAQPCSKKCRKELTRRNNILKYGVEHPMQAKEVQEHHKQSMMERYGVESPLQSKEIKERAIQTNREKFGTSWGLANKEVREKSKDTMIKRYGAATTLESSVLRKKVEDTCLEKYGVNNAMQNDDIRMKCSNTTFMHYKVFNPMQNEEILNECGSGLLRNTAEGIASNACRQFVSKLEDSGIHAEFEFSEIPGYRYDIVIPDQKILIEIDPTYTHNALGNHWTDVGLDKNYHLEKSEAARQSGYRCIHVFDWDDWDLIIGMLKPKERIYARKCRIVKLNSKIVDPFLRSNHLQGTVSNQVLCLGLTYNDELVQVMTFGKPRYNKNYYTELLRLCTASGKIVIGGAERLFKFAVEQLNVDGIISYCDLSKFNGEVYSRIGMKLKDVSGPREVWSKEDRKITANLLNQRGYDQLFNTNYGKGTSNEELMIQNGWLPVYDCGQAAFEYWNE